MKPKLYKIILTDYATFATLVLFFIGIAMGLFYSYFRESRIDVLFVISVISLVISLYRLFYVRTIISTGHECQAIVRKVWFYKDRGRIEFTYSYEGRVISTGNAIMKNRVTREVVKGMTLTAVVNKKNPKKAFILELYQ